MAKLCEVLCVSRSSYYAWDKRPDSKRSKENKKLLEKIQIIHNKSNKVYGSFKITKAINKDSETPINHNSIILYKKANTISA